MSTKQSGNAVLWVILGVVAIGLAVAIVWRFFAATDALNEAEQATQNSQTRSTVGTVEIKEYGVTLTYDKTNGEATYKIADKELTDASGKSIKSKVIELENASLTNNKAGCEGEGKPSFTQLGSISVQDTIETGEFAPASYIKVGDEYLVYNYLKMNISTDDPCFDETLDKKSSEQKKNLSDSFNKQAAENTARQ